VARPTSFRLPEQLLDRLDDEAAARATSVTALVTALLDEGLKASRFPGVVYRDGPAGRRAGLVGGPDVWEVIRDIKHAPGKGQRRVRHLAEELGVAERQIQVALDFYSVFPEEVDALLDRTSPTRRGELSSD
jgi:hypothetical protein